MYDEQERILADWTKYLSFINIITALSSIASLFVGYWTYSILYQQLDELKSASKQFDQSIDQSRSMAETARKALEKSDRPWMDITVSSGGKIVQGQDYHIDVEYKNVGKA